MKKKDPLFYVELRDNFSEKIKESREPSFFDNSSDPYLLAAGRIHRKKEYPVIDVPTQSDIIILDDQGLPFQVSSSLFKYSQSH